MDAKGNPFFQRIVSLPSRGKDTIDFALNASDYKIAAYIDTAGCVSCQLKLADWQRFMEEVDAASLLIPLPSFMSIPKM